MGPSELFQESTAEVIPTPASIGAVLQSPEELAEEGRKIRRLQMVINMVMQVIAQDPMVTVDQAAEMVADTRRLALGMFPEKELAFNLIYWSRLQRLMRERFRIQ
jgi:hypothetical protein